MKVRKASASLAVTIILAGLILVREPARTSAPQSVAFLNVGQGDAALLRDGNGFDVLIDGGIRSASATILNYLRAQAVPDLDVVVATHPDADHIGGLIGVLAAADIPVLKVFYNGCVGDTQTWFDLVESVQAEGLALEALRFPAELSWGAMDVYVLHPASGAACRADTNKDSLVLRVDFGSTRYLFTGDIDANNEAAVVARQTPVAAEVLKVSHHGSAGSSSSPFLSAVVPADSVISVGNNSYGHPAPEALERLRLAGSRVWRTDRNGVVRVESDGITFQVIPEVAWKYVFLPFISD